MLLTQRLVERKTQREQLTIMTVSFKELEKITIKLFLPGYVTRYRKEMRVEQEASVRSGAWQEIWVTVMVDGN